MSSPRSTVGLDFCTINNIKAVLTIASENGFNFIRGHIINPRNVRDCTSSNSTAVPLTRSDLLLNSQDWTTMILGRISDWIDCDSQDEEFLKLSEATLKQELSYSCHLGLFGISVSLHGPNHINLGRIIHNKILKSMSMLQAWIHVPMVSPNTVAESLRKDKPNIIEESTWHWWKKFLLMCNNDKNVGLLLEVTADLPSPEELNRWLGEPIKAVLLPTSIFLTNSKGYPVLSQPHQIFLKKVSSICSRVILAGTNRHGSLRHYVKYINHIYEMPLPITSSTPFSQGYEDHLQLPLQPLMDNLESTIYETFEKDPIKYTEYQKAIYSALVDRTADSETKKQVLMVVGAGRGPLVNASLQAAEMANVDVKIYAVEKNPNAFNTLCNTKEDVWKERVELINCDMRFWEPPEKCDILISELLGSFSDNELSPECLDGAQKFLKDDGISIPCKYTSYLKPIQSSKLFSEVHSFNPVDKPKYTTYESPYVVHQINVYSIAPEQPVFVFEHPNKSGKMCNDKYKVLKFHVSQDCVLHGFSGYFDTILYKHVMLSIVPQNLSKGMFSWFPMYFPIKDPIPLKQDDTLVVHMWRQSDSKQVWYEWCISEPCHTYIHNPNGRSYSIGLY